MPGMLEYLVSGADIPLAACGSHLVG